MRSPLWKRLSQLQSTQRFFMQNCLLLWHPTACVFCECARMRKVCVFLLLIWASPVQASSNCPRIVVFPPILDMIDVETGRSLDQETRHASAVEAVADLVSLALPPGTYEFQDGSTYAVGDQRVE